MCNRPSQIHCLNSDGTGDLSLLRYKPDFVTSLFVLNDSTVLVNEIYFIYNEIEKILSQNSSKIQLKNRGKMQNR
jgi:hypothetical protein